MRVAFCIALATVGLTGGSYAAIVNGDFEDPPQTSGAFSTGTPPGWTTPGGAAGVWHVVSLGYFDTLAPSGVQVGYINSGSMAQQTSDVLLEGNTQVDLYFGRRKDGFQGSSKVELYAGGSVAAGVVTGGTLLASLDVAQTDVAVGAWEAFSLGYTALGSDPSLGQALSVRIEKTSGSQIDFDQVVLTTPVPEPASLGAIALGLGFLAKRRRG